MTAGDTPAFAYPTPIQLARLRAEAERDRLGDPAASPVLAALWGRLGGLVTLDRHGREHFARMARRRWDR